MSTVVFHVYLRQRDRRWHPCIVLRDAQGLVAAHVAPANRPASMVSWADIEVLKTFRGAERMRYKSVPHRGPVSGKWRGTAPGLQSYMLSRPDVPGCQLPGRWCKGEAQSPWQYPVQPDALA